MFTVLAFEEFLKRKFILHSNFFNFKTSTVVKKICKARCCGDGCTSVLLLRVLHSTFRRLLSPRRERDAPTAPTAHTCKPATGHGHPVDRGSNLGVVTSSSMALALILPMVGNGFWLALM